jgi:hypothetical protein
MLSRWSELWSRSIRVPPSPESLKPIDTMSDAELRTLVADEHSMVVEAGEAIIARRHAADRITS